LGFKEWSNISSRVTVVSPSKIPVTLLVFLSIETISVSLISNVKSGSSPNVVNTKSNRWWINTCQHYQQKSLFQWSWWVRVKKFWPGLGSVIFLLLGLGQLHLGLENYPLKSKFNFFFLSSQKIPGCQKYVRVGSGFISSDDIYKSGNVRGVLDLGG